MKIEFTKMTGAGNDFVVIDNRGGFVRDGSGLARRLCDRHFGIGGDGLLLLEKSEKADFRMMYYNADGSYGGMCGNGGRCIARYAALNSIAGDRMKFEALDWVYEANVDGTTVSLKMKDPSGLEQNIMLPTSKGTIKCHFVDTGAPHVVILVQDQGWDLGKLDVNGIGKEIRYHQRFKPTGTNVNFVERLDKSTLRLRTYERGVENETLACGTGSIGAALVGYVLGLADPGVVVRVQSGSELKVKFDRKKDGVISDVVLAGPADIVFTGLWEFDSVV